MGEIDNTKVFDAEIAILVALNRAKVEKFAGFCAMARILIDAASQSPNWDKDFNWLQYMSKPPEHLLEAHKK